MNAVEIDEAVSELAGNPFDPAEFPYAFLAAFGNKDTTINPLRERKHQCFKHSGRRSSAKSYPLSSVR